MRIDYYTDGAREVPVDDHNDETVTFEEVVRLGREASEQLGRPITDGELRQLHSELEQLRIGAALAELWTAGRVAFSLRDGELVVRHRQVSL